MPSGQTSGGNQECPEEKRQKKKKHTKKAKKQRWKSTENQCLGNSPPPLPQNAKNQFPSPSCSDLKVWKETLSCGSSRRVMSGRITPLMVLWGLPQFCLPRSEHASITKEIPVFSPDLAVRVMWTVWFHFHVLAVAPRERKFFNLPALVGKHQQCQHTTILYCGC